MMRAVEHYRVKRRAARVGLLIGVGVCNIAGCPRPEDGFEENDTINSATPVLVGQPIVVRTLQNDADVFVIEAEAGAPLRFRFESLGEEEESCAAFRLTAPDGTILFDDEKRSCTNGLTEPVQAPGVALTYVAGIGYELSAPPAAAGTYTLTINVFGYADNLFTYSWRYRMSVEQL